MVAGATGSDFASGAGGGAGFESPVGGGAGGVVFCASPAAGLGGFVVSGEESFFGDPRLSVGGASFSSMLGMSAFRLFCGGFAPVASQVPSATHECASC